MTTDIKPHSVSGQHETDAWVNQLNTVSLLYDIVCKPELGTMMTINVFSFPFIKLNATRYTELIWSVW